MIGQMTPEWSHRAGHVLESRYFEPDYDDDFSKRSDEKSRLQDDLIEGAASYDELSPEGKAIWDRAEAAEKAWQEFVASDAAGFGRALEDWTGDKDYVEAAKSKKR